MTNDNIIEIKKQKKDWFVKGFIFLFLMLISLFVALMPLISEFAKANSALFYIVGFSAFIIFAALYSLNLYVVLKPANALILSARGFTDRINVGDGIEIEWTNVSAVKMLGKSNMPFLGITLENYDIILSKMKNNLAAEMRENIDQNLPTILIPQSKVRISIKELKETFAKFAREARALEKDLQQKQKHNPFSTDDVLRAFGKLPKEDENNDIETDTGDSIIEPEEDNIDKNETALSEITNIDVIEEEIEENDVTDDDIKLYVDDINKETTDEDTASETPVISEPNAGFALEIEDDLSAFRLDNNAEIKYESPFEIPEDIPSKSTSKPSASDSFYEALRTKACIKNECKNEPDDEIPNESISEHFDQTAEQIEEMPDEIRDLLSRAKSSRIAEIEKILNETDIPYSLSRDDSSSTVNINNDNNVVEDISLANDAEDVEDAEINIDISLNKIDESSDTDSNALAPSLNGIFENMDEADDNENLSFNLDFISENDQKLPETSSLNDMIQNELAISEFNDSNNLSDTKEFIFDN